ncbi:MAG: biopolymer transporter ExbD [bacterium]|nr:biopolymer transporter ExbD [bacterium]
MAGEVIQKTTQDSKKGRRPKRRIAVRIDMTPMVDIAFLLLIFYMVSTVFAMPQAMEINLPRTQDQPIIRESDLMTIRVDSESRFWWHLKTASPANLPELLPSSPGSVPYAFNADTVRGLLLERNRANSKLSTLVLIHPDACYEDMVNVLDEIDVIERSWNDYTAQQNDIDVEDLTETDGRFSYRYAIGDWETGDDKIMADAQAAARASGEL